MNLGSLARALGGDIVGAQILCPGPRHSAKDRSLSVRFSALAPDGFVVFSHAGDDAIVCKDYVRGKLGLRRARFDQVTKRGPGNPRIAEQPHDPETGRKVKADPDVLIVDNINDKVERPTGTSKEASLRTLQKHAAEGNKDGALAIWNAAVDLRGTLGETYLTRDRGLDVADDLSHCLRWHAPIRALIGLFRDIRTDEPRAITRIFLDQDSHKITRKFLGAVGGCAVKIDADENVEYGLCIGEGVETCLAARQIGLRPVWACGSVSAIAGFSVLSGIDALTIFAETGEPSAKAIDQCGARWHAAGREVVVIDPLAGSDVNDSIREPPHG